MRTLPSESVDLVYIDPPFFSNRVYNVIWGDEHEKRSFSDIWEGGLDGYLIWLNARLYEMKRLLKPTGSIYVHCDWHASHYIKVEMDKIFGYDKFRERDCLGLLWRKIQFFQDHFFGRRDYDEHSVGTSREQTARCLTHDDVTEMLEADATARLGLTMWTKMVSRYYRRMIGGEERRTLFG